MGASMMNNSPIDSEAVALLGLMLVSGVGRTTALQALRAAQRVGVSLERFVQMPVVEVAQVIPPGCEAVVEARKRYEQTHRRRAGELFERVARGGATVLRIDEGAYPAALPAALGRTAPPLLFVRGNTALLAKPAAGIVGARNASARGLGVAAACAQAFAAEDIPIVSGGAAGVDSAAHEAALDWGGSAIIVLPQGILDYCVPRCVEEALHDERAVVVSEFVPDAPWETHAAVTRNATISALARMVCVIEPKKTGGSIRTARHGLAQGKTVAVFGEDESAAGVAQLREEGALPLLDERGGLDGARLVTLWRTEPAAQPAQDMLW